MATIANMRAALMRCGLNNATANYVITDQGFDSPHELLMASQESVDVMFKNAIRLAPADVLFSTASIRRINAFKFWAEQRALCGLSTLPQLFTVAELTDYLLIVRANEIEVTAKKDQVPTKPDALKAEKEWFKFWEKLKNYLGRIRGAAKVPLSYVVRDHEAVTDAMRDAVHETHAKKLTAILRLSGQHYDIDNESVWEIIKSLVIDGFGWSFVKRYDRTMDGRSAILALRRQCEGKTSIKTRKNKAYASIASSRYRGIRKQFTFAQYVAIHQAAHNELEDCNEPLPETKKVSDFLNGISDPSLESGITVVLSDDKYSDDFEATQQFLGTLVANQQVHRQNKRGGDEDRNVSSTEKGGGKNKKGNKNGKVNKKKIKARFYTSAEEWSKLTTDERAQVIELKKQKKENKDKQMGSTKRKMSSVETEKDEEGEEAAANGDRGDSDQAGNEFGRGAHKKKKVTISAATTVVPTRATIRHVMAATTPRRFVMDSTMGTTSMDDRVELDTHADTCVAGSNTVVLDLTGKMVSVSPFCESEYPTMEDVPVATVATAYDCPKTGKAYVLVINEALYFGDKMRHTLLCPNQLRANGVKVDDCPKQYDATSTHSIQVADRDLMIPLTMRGVISGFYTRKPTEEELANVNDHIELTADTEWDPYADTFSTVEERHETTWDPSRSLSVVTTAPRKNIDPLVEISIAEQDDLCERLVSMVRLSDGVPRSADAVVRTATSAVITAEDVARRWNIGLTAANQTLKVTTQLGVRVLKHPAQRRFRTVMPHLRYPRLKGTWYADTLFFTTKSVRGFKCAHLIGNGLGLSKFMPLESKADAHLSLTSFIHQNGIMENLVVDGDPTMAYKEWQKTIREFRVNQTTTEPYSPWQNRAELDVREVKRAVRRFKKRSGSPRRLWCFLGEHVSTLRGLTAYDAPKLQGRCAAEHALGYTPDISPWIQHQWYENVWYRDADGEHKIGKWLGMASGIGGGDGFWILPTSARPIARSTVWSITRDELAGDAIKAAIRALDESINSKIGDHLNDEKVIEQVGDLEPADGDLLEDLDDDSVMEVDSLAPEDDGDFTPETFDGYLTASVMLPRGGEVLKAQVVARKRDSNGNPIGRAHSNPILDTREYVVEFEDGVQDEYAANLIAENMYSQIDEEGKTHMLLSEIVDHEADGRAMKIADGLYTDKQGRQRPRITAKGWRLLVEWKDGTTSWAALKDLKESFPIETAEYAVANKISDEPAFKWWVQETLRKRHRIIKKLKSAKYWKRTHKYGIRLPHSVEEALKIDEETGTDFWRKGIEKEMKNVMPAFEFRDDDKMPIGYECIRCHMVFDIKIGDLTRKARFCANGNETDPPKESTFSTVVSRETVRLFFLMAALHDTDILSADIQNAYLNAPVKEKLYTIAGKEFGPKNQGRPVMIVRALYGLRSSGKAFRDHLAMHLREMGYQNSKADPDLWMKPDTKSSGVEYYHYVICYVDDVAATMENPKDFMDELAQRFTLKEGSVQEPTLYLGADVIKWYIAESEDPGKPRWAMASTKYTRRDIADLEIELDAIGKRLSTKITTPLASNYRPEIDQTQELDAQRQHYFQGLVGVLRWICELGRLDILMPVSMMSRYLVAARSGHLDQLFHIFAYLKKYDASTMVFDDTEPDFDERRFKQCDWTEYYPGAAEAIPHDMPKPRGRPVIMSCFVDADHAGCLATRRSHTGVVMFVNRAPILWFSKRQNTVESSTFGSEFVAMRIAIEMIEGLRYKLRMMGVDLDGPCNVFCDNNAVVLNSSNPESVLKKKHAAVNYHRVREAVAAGTIRIAKEDTATNIADILTKCLPGPKLREHAQRILW